MSHMIESNQLAYVGAVPWHGLGVQVPEGSTGTEMLTAAGLNWQVKSHRIFTRQATDGKVVEIESSRAIVRQDSNKVFMIAGHGYQPHQTSDIVGFFQEFCLAGNATMETVGALKDGAVVWALAKLQADAKRIIGGVDELKGYMLLATSFDGSLKTTGSPTQVRVVCHNTLTAARSGMKRETTFQLSHRSKFDEAARNEAKRVMGMAVERMIETNDLAADLARVTIDESGWLTFMTKLMGDDIDKVLDKKTGELTRIAGDIQEATMHSPGATLATARGTLWGAVNGVTYYVDHAARSRSDSNRMFSAWFAGGNGLKNRAVDAAKEMAGV